MGKCTSPTDGTHIVVGLDTLAARQPTLAALAYLTRPLTSSFAYQSDNPPFVFGN